MGPHTTTHSTRVRRVDPVTGAFNVIVWISAVIVMGILSYLISLNNNQGSHVIYEETIAVLTVVFYLAAFFLGTGYVLLFNLIFSYLWLVAVAFTASDWTYANSPLLHAAEAFSFIALYVTPHLSC